MLVKNLHFKLSNIINRYINISDSHILTEVDDFINCFTG